MHGFEGAPAPTAAEPGNGPWWRMLNRYHWFVLIVSALGWLFDTMDQQLFVLARKPSMLDLVGPGDADFYGTIMTTIFLLGWATGGLVFGVLGDRFGRAKVMMWTILMYSLCTGLSALSVTFYDFAAYRFLTGLGVGGEFAVGVALVAEVMPSRARPFALGLLQALSAVGNVSAALISLGLGWAEESQLLEQGWAWRLMFVVGALPALLAIVIRARLREPEAWTAAKADPSHKPGSYGELFADPRWRRHALIGLLMTFAGVVGLWGIGFFSVDLTSSVFNKTFQQQYREQGEAERDREFLRLSLAHPTVAAKLEPHKPSDLLGPAAAAGDGAAVYGALLKLREQRTPVTLDAVLNVLDDGEKPQSAADRDRRRAWLEDGPPLPQTADLAAHADRIRKRSRELGGRLAQWAAYTSLALNFGAFFGIYGFSYLTHFIGRRPAFAIAYVAAAASTALVFWQFSSPWHILWMTPLMGFCQLSLFGGFAIYLPELFPTRLRSTGTSFCYNVGRFVAAVGPSSLGLLTKFVFADYTEPMRPAGITMCAVFGLGLLALLVAPETKNRPLPE